MTHLSENVIKKIKNDHIVPAARWHFLLKNYSLWGAFFFAVILGSLSFSVVVEMLAKGDWEISKHLGMSLFGFLLMVMPYFWLIFMLMLIVLAYFDWKYTKNSYHFKTYYVIMGSFGASIIFGMLFYSLGLGKKIDKLMANSIPYYQKSKEDSHREMWFQPDKGLLTGEVEEIDDAGNIVIMDNNGQEWQIQNENSANSDMQISSELGTVSTQVSKFDVKKVRPKKKGEKVDIIGQRDSDHIFVAREVRIIDEEESDFEKMLESDEKNEYEYEDEHDDERD